MPLRKSHPVLLLVAAAASLLGAVPAFGAASSTPAGSCTALPTTKAFKAVDGDASDYSLAPGGGFEIGATPWTLSGAARPVLGNETLGVKPGLRSLRLPLGSSATSPEFCVDQTKPHFRFAFKVDNAAYGGFMALVIYRDAEGKLANVELTSSKRITLHPTFWQASDNSPLATLLPLDSTRRIATVQLKFISLLPADVVDALLTPALGDNPLRTELARASATLQQAAATIASPFFNIGVTIDSVMIDPYRRG